MTDTAIETAGLGKRYKRAWALQDCTLHLPTGRIAALVGPNGAGKTTLLHLAVGLLAPDAGSVRVFGRTRAATPRQLAEIGFVAQDTPLYRGFTAPEPDHHGRQAQPDLGRRAARTRLSDLGIAPNLPVGKALRRTARPGRPRPRAGQTPPAAAARRADRGLDPLARHEFMQALMGAVAETGTTVLLSSHLLADLERACDYLIVLQTAHVQLSGPVDELLEGHRTLVGPRTDTDQIPGVAEVIRASHTDRQSTLLARTDGTVPTDPAWSVHEVTLEDLVLAYLAKADTRSTRTAWEVNA